MENINFTELTSTELVEIDGGKGWGWLGLLQPIYDFGRGFVDGFKSGLDSE